MVIHFDNVWLQQVDINQELENIKSVILESAEETIKIREKNIRTSGGTRNVNLPAQEKTS
jgi:hypothetical protein